MSDFQNGNSCVKRYEFAPEECDGDSGRCFAEMQVDPDGDYFLVEDVIELIEDEAEGYSHSVVAKAAVLGILKELRPMPPKSGDTEVDDGA
jgi:hypothetical protein